MTSIRLDRWAAALSQYQPALDSHPSRIPAAVAVVVAPDPDSLLLIQRSERVGDRWSGHMAFPGGRSSAGDPDLLTTARRETWEEVGVDLGLIDPVGRLDDLSPQTPTLPPVTVSPFVFRITERASLFPNEEVARAAWISVDTILDPAIRRSHRPMVESNLLFPAFHLEQGVVWGMTERILANLLHVVEGVTPIEG